VDTVPDPLLLRKFGNAENVTRDIWIYSQELCPLTTEAVTYEIKNRFFVTIFEEKQRSYCMPAVPTRIKQNCFI
jgi:hypothetical protein